MKRLTWDISIGKYKLAMVESVKIVRSVENLADTAEIVLPATVMNKTIEVESKLAKGDAVSISLGYGEKLLKEFDGYLKTVKTDGGSLTLECEDALFLFRVPMKDQEIQSPSVKTLLQMCVNEVRKQKGIAIKIDCNYSFSYDKFVFSNATAFDVLKKIQDEAKPNVYMKENTLHVHPQYSEIFGSVVYDFEKNIDRDGNDLKYVKKDDRKTLVKIEYTDAKGHKKTVEYGDTGGTVKKKRGGTADIASLKLLAKNEYESYCYDGYEGNITGWLFPYCDAGYKVTIKDSDYEYKEGTYYVVGVTVEFGNGGGKRIVQLGKRI